MNARLPAWLAASLFPLWVALFGCDALLPVERDAPAAAPVDEVSSSQPPAGAVAGATGSQSVPASAAVAGQSTPSVSNPHPVQTRASAPAAVGAPASSAETAAAGAAARGSLVRLSTGVVLPQTLPEGTAILVSLEYQFIGGGPAADAQYALVIQPARGAAVEVPVQLESSGILQTYTYDLRPEQAPFSASLREVTATGESRTLSESIELR